MEKKFMSMMDEKRVFEPSEEIKKKAYIKNMEEYKKLYKQSVDDPERFWGSRRTFSTGTRNGTRFQSGISASPN